jgi:histidinol phosphatase-like PHP family hydrolase
MDYVVVSVHASFAMSEGAMTNRIIKAMQNARTRQCSGILPVASLDP